MTAKEIGEQDVKRGSHMIILQKIVSAPAVANESR